MELLKALRQTIDRLRSGEELVLEKRGLYRVGCELPAMVVVNAKEAQSAVLVNLTSRGMKLRVDRRLAAGQIYRIILRAGHHREPTGIRRGATEVSLRATVVWCRKSGGAYDVGCLFYSFAGLRTDDVISFFREQLQVPVSKVSQLRRFTRIQHSFGVEMSMAGRDTVKGAVRDLSLEGVQLTIAHEVEPGTTVRLRIALSRRTAIETEARVMRCRPDLEQSGHYEVGARFHPLPEAQSKTLARAVSRYLKDRWP